MRSPTTEDSIRRMPPTYDCAVHTPGEACVAPGTEATDGT